MTALSKGGSRVLARRLATDSRGAVALEFALVLPILAMLLIGMVTTGYSYSHVMGLTNAVREGARFGATSNADPAVNASWAANVIARVRQTQFDDPGSPPETAICVQLWQGPAVGGSELISTVCDQGNNSVLLPGGLTMPSAGDAKRGIPTLSTGQCVVRVIAARNYDINYVFGRVTAASASYAVERYERMDAYTTCV